jgi:excisionase family DNA binding protein
MSTRTTVDTAGHKQLALVGADAVSIAVVQPDKTNGNGGGARKGEPVTDHDQRPARSPAALGVDPQQQLSIPQVAALLQCSERWLYGKIRGGELHATHLGRAVRVSRENLQRFLDAQQAWVPPSRRAS